MIKFSKIIEKKQDANEQIKDGVKSEVFWCEEIGDTHDHLAKGDNHKERNPLDQVREVDRDLLHLFAEGQGHEKGGENPDKVNSDAHVIRQKRREIDGARACAQNQKEALDQVLVVLRRLLFNILDHVLYQQGQGQGPQRPGKGVKIALPIVGKHIGQEQKQAHVRKHDDHVKEGIFPVSVGEHGLDHPGVDQDDQAGQKSENAVQGQDPVVQVVDKPCGL